MRTQTVRRNLKAYEREHGVPEPVRETARTRRLSAGYVAFWPDRADEPTGSKVIHHETDCPSLAHVPERSVREATAEELAAMAPCGICAD